MFVVDKHTSKSSFALASVPLVSVLICFWLNLQYHKVKNFAYLSSQVTLRLTLARAKGSSFILYKPLIFLVYYHKEIPIRNYDFANLLSLNHSAAISCSLIAWHPKNIYLMCLN